MQVKQWGDGNVMVVIGSANGGISRMRFKVPLGPGSALAEIQASPQLSTSSQVPFFSLHTASAQAHERLFVSVCRWLIWIQTLTKDA